MEPQQRQQDDSDAYLAAFEAANRKRRILILAVGIIITSLCIGAFIATLGSLGKMSGEVEGAFTEKENPEAATVPTERTPGESVPVEAASSDASPAEPGPEAEVAPAP